ncbi:MAG: aldolase [Kineosporiaceae bacterium]|nr:aldolase [Kineosporiaceae bacterium]
MTAISDAAWAELVRRRTYEPHRIAPAYADRRAPSSWFNEAGNLFLVAADHPGRGALAIGANPMAMAGRRRLLDRLVTALAHPDVNGVLGSPDIVEELLLLGALDGKVVIGSMNRGGLDGAVWTMDDRFTGYDAAAIARCGLQGGKMLLRIDDSDPGVAPTLQACAGAVSELADRGLMAMVEPLPYTRDSAGSPQLLRDPGALARAATVASALGTSSAFTWLKMPACEEPDVVFGATTLPCVVLGGAPGPDREAALASWGRTLRQDVVRGLVVGRSLLYPPDDDVAGAVDAAARVLRAAAEEAPSP